MKSNRSRSPQVTVIGDSDASEQTRAAAEQIGAMLARRGITLITGGRGGVMEAASRGAREAGGITVGILPTADMSDANQWCSIVIATGMGSARNVVNVLACDLLISIGSSAGTLSELCFAWIHGKPILTLKGYGAWPERLGSEPLDHRATSTITECASMEELEQAVVQICRELDLIK
ncbi:MAG TPA: TIGR00725 family protein [Blastocatellia bacterium]|nr:TIGR00725 family protein [Blastocatellia bacterium]